MAFHRASPVAADLHLVKAVEAEIDAILELPRDKAKVAKEASEMRALIEKEKPPRDKWDLKLIPGGLIDLEFIAQYALLTGQIAGNARPTGTRLILAQLAPALAGADARQELVEAHTLFSGLTQMTRLCLTGRLEPN